ncbi:hypothetical protein [Rhizobium halophytocola]|uniref:DUF4175 domain-containing protein n=1 Tax=Rhizobium halophytocola TaxID=735519 RepID=A0ABS4E6E4_9HYPH|nr:hypothetical protein [Rhizobium halophytocola]MBP1853520.1 hypothetical protein [Rhizobium halophytocola]
MSMNRVLALLAFLVLAVFLGLLFWRVPRVDLGIFFVATLAAAAYDLLIYHGRNDHH